MAEIRASGLGIAAGPFCTKLRGSVGLSNCRVPSVHTLGRAEGASIVGCGFLAAVPLSAYTQGRDKGVVRR